MNHVVTIRPNPHADNSKYKFENVCTCQWQMLCMSLEIADSHAVGHLSYHGVRENVDEHIIKPEPEAASEILPAVPEALEEPRPAYHPEGTLKPKVLVGANPKALDAS